MDSNSFEDLLGAITTFSDSFEGQTQSPNSRRACADKFLKQHPEVTPQSMRAFLTHPSEQIREEHFYVTSARIGAHCFRILSDTDENMLSLAKSTDVPWYIKQEIMHALALPMSRIDWDDVKGILLDDSLENEVRGAALELVVANNKRDFLPFLLTLSQSLNDTGYFSQKLALKIRLARASLGDMDTVIATLRSKISPHWVERRDAEDTWMHLVEAVGSSFYIVKHLIGEMGRVAPKSPAPEMWLNLQEHKEPAVCIWALEEASASDKQDEKCRDLLSSSNWLVQMKAAEWLTENLSNPQTILEMVGNNTLSLESRRWAAFVFVELGGDTDELTKLDMYGENLCAVEWGFKSPASIRKAIVQEYAPGMAPGSDIRYRIENQIDNSPIYSEAENDRQRLLEALKDSTITVTSCQSAGDFNQQGDGCFWVISMLFESERYHLNLSSLGPFAASYHIDAEGYGKQPDQFDKAIQEILKQVDVIWIDENFQSQIVPALNVYFFGSREPLSIRDLLFYWQD